jgi:hypothetical protein
LIYFEVARIVGCAIFKRKKSLRYLPRPNITGELGSMS